MKGTVAEAKKAAKKCKKTAFCTPVLSQCMKAVATMIACLSQPVQQEFLLDTGAGRNLISSKSLPQSFREHVHEANEPIEFCTGGGIRPSAEVVDLSGELSGTNTFYMLKDCPHALSAGLQVEQHGRPFVWFPGQLPYLIKADRVSDVVHHVPESARIYADRVEQNVPILSESVAVAAPDAVSGMPATGGEPSSSSKGDTSRPSVRPHELLAPDAKAFEEAPPTPGHPSDLPRSKRGVKLDDSLPHFGVEEELLAAREPETEPGDEPLTSEDEEWTLIA